MNLKQQNMTPLPPQVGAVILQPGAIEVVDQTGAVWIRKHPFPGLICIPLGALELFELYCMFDTRSSNAVAQGNPKFWADSEVRAAELLALAVTLAPAFAAFQQQRRQHPDGTSREGTV